MKKRASKHLVPVGTHVPTATKLGLQAIAESQGQSVYEFLQELIQSKVDEFEHEINKLKEKTPQVEKDDSDLL